MAKFVAEYDYTNAENLALYKEAMARVAKTGTSYTVAGRTFTMANLNELRETVRFYQRLVNAETGGMSKTLVRLGRRG